MDYNNINYKTIAISLAVLLVVAVGSLAYVLTVNSDLKAEIHAKNDIMANLFEQNAAITELMCAYAKAVGGPAPEICKEG